MPGLTSRGIQGADHLVVVIATNLKWHSAVPLWVQEDWVGMSLRNSPFYGIFWWGADRETGEILDLVELRIVWCSFKFNLRSCLSHSVPLSCRSRYQSVFLLFLEYGGSVSCSHISQLSPWVILRTTLCLFPLYVSVTKEFLARYISSARPLQFLPDLNCPGWLFGLSAYCCFAWGCGGFWSFFVIAVTVLRWVLCFVFVCLF